MVEVQADRVQVEICAPERSPIRLEAREVVVPGAHGVFTVLPGHTTLLSTLASGTLVVYDTEGKEQFFAVHGGFAEVNFNRIVVLTVTAETDDEIDVKRAEAALERAEQRLKQRDEKLDFARAEAALERALARLLTHQRKSY